MARDEFKFREVEGEEEEKYQSSSQEKPVGLLPKKDLSKTKFTGENTDTSKNVLKKYSGKTESTDRKNDLEEDKIEKLKKMEGTELKEDVVSCFCEFTEFLFLLTVEFHWIHLLSNRYGAEHKVLGKFYEKLPEFSDRFAESFLGKYSWLKEYSKSKDLEMENISYPDISLEERMENIQMTFGKCYGKMKEMNLLCPSLETILGELDEHIKKTTYLLRME